MDTSLNPSYSRKGTSYMTLIERFKENPLLSPEPGNDWEANAVFNACPVKIGKVIHLLYRAISAPKTINGKTLNVSSIGHAVSKDGINFENRTQFIKPEEVWEKYGCEDPRVTAFERKYYIFYTALSGFPPATENIRVGLAVTGDMKTIERKELVTPFNAKAMALFPERVDGKIAAVLSVDTDKPPATTALALFDREEQIWSRDYWDAWYRELDQHMICLRRGDRNQVEIGAPPIKTKKGWLLIYSDIKNYLSPFPRLYGVEAVILDSKDPKKIVSRTEDPLLEPEENYEVRGNVPDVIFPSGALQKGENLNLYYGGADTVVCGAQVKLEKLIKNIMTVGRHIVYLERLDANPLLVPIKEHGWEAKAVFNPAALYLKDKVHIVYRAMSEDNTSTLGYASSPDGVHITERLPEPIYVPREPFEQKTVPGGNSGCEDPRLTRIGQKIHMTYTAYSGANSPRVALTSLSVSNFLKRKWSWQKPVLITPAGVDNKNTVLFPKKMRGKYVFLHRPDNRDIWIDFVSDLKFKGGFALGGHILMEPRKNNWDSEKVGAAAPPIETEKGWLLLYHALSKTSGSYRVGAVLLDKNNPQRVIARTHDPILVPRMTYERGGQVGKVVFPCGAVVLGDILFVYYGGADSVVCGAYISLNKLIRALLD